MRRLSLALLLCVLGVPLTAAAVHVKKLPEGVEIHGDVVKLKPGYVFKRVAANKAYSYRKGSAPTKGGSTRGSYSCTCSKGGGSCAARIDEAVQSLSCSKNGDCQACDLEITVEAPGRLEIKPKE
ncbi:MAG TPA: hypothetical protein VGK04_06805 [Thermoanaerobaculia bacterium]|jgi:hypothetical protein